MLHLRRRMNLLRHTSRLWLAGSLTFVAILLVMMRPVPATATAPQVTFNRDVAPIIFRSCSSCHRPGEAAPFSLLTYSDVKKHARQIADVVRSRSMPPWLPEPQNLKFADELRLSDAEINCIVNWVEQGAAEGD